MPKSLRIELTVAAQEHGAEASARTGESHGLGAQ